MSALVCGLLAACGTLPDGGEPRSFVSTYGVDSTRPEQFVYCHGASCGTHDRIALSAREWSDIRRAMTPPARSAGEERQQIALAVARYEAAAGQKTGTANDRGGNIKGMLENMFDTSQIDCVSETINTTTLILMLDDAGLLRWHEPGRPANRFGATGWFHSTAVVREKATGENFAIDSWFFDNGQPAAVVALKDWHAGWSPE